MRKTVFLIAALFAFLPLPFFPQESLDSAESDGGKTGTSSYSKAGESDVPPSKRPRAGDSAKIADLDNIDPDGRKKNADILKFGLEDEILDLLKTMIDRKDVRFVDEAYDLYEESKSKSVKEQVMNFFKTLEDPCLEDYAIMILNDPYDEPLDTVNMAFSYVGALKVSGAIPAVENLLEGDNEKYYDGALGALGKIGGGDESMYLTEYFEKEDLTLAQKQTLVKTLGSLHASETYDKLVEMAENEDENTFIRMYASEAIGQIAAEDASRRGDGISVLSDLFEDRDPNLRTYVVQGLSNFSGSEVEKTIVQALKDNHAKVRLEAIAAVKKMQLSEAVPYLVYRAKNDPDSSVKKACYPVIAEMNTAEGNEFLVSQITAKKKVSDDTKAKVATALLECNNAGTQEILALASEVLSDDRRKPLRYALGKEFAKYGRAEYEDICKQYLASKDVATQGTGLDIYAKARYASVTPTVQNLADQANPDAKTNNANARKAARILGVDWEKSAESPSSSAQKTADAK